MNRADVHGMLANDVAQLAEALSSFFEDQKLRAQERIRKCETFLNHPLMQSKSVKDGLICLLSNAEDDYSTFLHLERVLNMENADDFFPELSRAEQQRTDFGQWASGDHLRRRSTADAATAAESFHEGEGFVMGDDRENGSDISDLDLDVAAKSFKEPPPLAKRSSPATVHEDDDEPDEYSDVPLRCPVVAISARRNDKTVMARSLPVSIPLPEKNVQLEGSILVSDGEDDENKNPENIPKKIAEIAKSLYDRSVHGELPTSPQLTQDI